MTQNLQSLANSHPVAVILTSRKEAKLYKRLSQSSSIEMRTEDIDADIRAFVEAKIAANPRLSHSSIRDLIVQRLCNNHGGMLLWVQLMIKELKSCISISQVQGELRALPDGLNAVYGSILKRLQDTLDKHALQLCSKVLMWVVTAIVSIISIVNVILNTHS